MLQRATRTLLLLAIPFLGACGEDENFPPACNDSTVTGEYIAYFCDAGASSFTAEATCEEARSNCDLNASLDPSDRSMVCWWRDRVFFRREKFPGACPTVPPEEVRAGSKDRTQAGQACANTAT